MSIADGSEGEIINPSLPGPYEVGYFDDSHKTDCQPYSTPLRYYYPAISSGNNAIPDDSSAPYPVIMWTPTQATGLHANMEILEHLTSHGMIVLLVDIDWVDVTPWEEPFGGWAEEMDDILDYTEDLNTSWSSKLYGMIDDQAYGSGGHHWGGAVAGIYVTSIDVLWMDRIEAAVLLTPFYNATNPWEIGAVVTKPVHIQIGERDRQEMNGTREYYDAVPTEKSMVTLLDSDLNGPYRPDLLVAFYKYYLEGDTEYKTYLYGDEAFMDLSRGETDLRFDLRNGNVFPPKWVMIEADHVQVDMDEGVILSLDIKGHQIDQYPMLHVDWIVNSNASIITAKDDDVSYSFNETGDYKIEARWWIGGTYGWLVPLKITVTNPPPLAVPGPTGTFEHDSTVTFDGSASRDTKSHVDNLSYRWSFSDGEETEFSHDPTWTRMLSNVTTIVATLHVRDPLGEESNASCTIVVENVAPSASAEGPTWSLEDEVVTFKGSGTDTVSHRGSLEFRWDFGDGSISDWHDVAEITHIYTEMKSYDAILWVRDPLEKRGNDTLRIRVENVAPEGGIQQPGDGDEMLTDTRLGFIGWGRDTTSDHNTLRYTWDFGDGGTAEGAWVFYTYRDSGDHDVTLTVEDDDGATNVTIIRLTIQERGETGIGGPMMVSTSILLVVILALAAVATTEPGKYTLGLLTAPLFTRSKDVMDNKTRLALHGVIVENPGIHYSAIREEMGLANGEAAYHLHVMERESFIRSVRDGKLKRFYSAHTKVPEGVGLSPDGTRDAIVELVRDRPGISQLEVIEELGLSRDKASYYLRELVDEGRLADEREGKYTVYNVRRGTRKDT